MESTQRQSGVYVQDEEEEYFMGPRYFSHSQGDAGVSFAALLEVKQNRGDFVSTCCVYTEDDFTKTGLGQTQVQGKLKAVGVSHSDGLSLRGSDTALRRTFPALNAQHLLAVRLHGV